MEEVMVRPERCIGCKHCEVACAVEHSAARELAAALGETPVSVPRIRVEVGMSYLTFPNRCRHCDPAPCLQVCPTNALVRDERTGLVAQEYARCIRCTACAMACPFGVIQFKPVLQTGPERVVNAKCDGCLDRRARGEVPACAEACKTGALVFGEVNELIRSDRKSFTLRMLTSREPEVEAPGMPANLRAFRDLMAELAGLGPSAE
nr:4Fe-4S dicluster domain-containing protein [Candidatus Solincola tengchongensis]